MPLAATLTLIGGAFQFALPVAVIVYGGRRADVPAVAQIVAAVAVTIWQAGLVYAGRALSIDACFRGF